MSNGKSKKKGKAMDKKQQDPQVVDDTMQDPQDAQDIQDAGSDEAQGAGEQYRVVTGGKTLNIRQEPSLTAKVICAVPNGGNVFVVGVEGQWASVQGGGFTMAKYLEVTK